MAYPEDGFFLLHGRMVLVEHLHWRFCEPVRRRLLLIHLAERLNLLGRLHYLLLPALVLWELDLWSEQIVAMNGRHGSLLPYRDDLPFAKGRLGW